jgi:hypothetical protein
MSPLLNRSHHASPSSSVSGAVLTASPNIVFDGKGHGASRLPVWRTAGTGTISYTQPHGSLSVTAGQYAVQASAYCIPYFAGYTMYTELTVDTFQHEAGVTKRMGLFTTSTTAPYTAAADGYWVQTDGERYTIEVYHAGTQQLSVPITEWDGREHLLDYDWSKFTVMMFEHLWLGGAALRLWVMIPEVGWIVAHSVPYAGVYEGSITRSPQNLIRYDIYSTTGTGTLRPICAQASVQGDVSRHGFFRTGVNSATIPCNTLGTVYALQGLRKAASYLHVPARITGIASDTASTNDTGLLYLLRNPTLSAPLSYSALHTVERAEATNQTVTALGEIMMCAPSAQTASLLSADDYGSWLTYSVDGTRDEYVLAFEPLTTNQSMRSIISWQEYS